MAVLSRTIAVPKAEAPADPIMGEMDSLHILPLKIIPFRNSVLKSSRLIKNSRLETVVELFRHAEGASGQVAVNDIWGILGVDPEALEIQAFAPEQIPWHGIAFKTTMWALRDWIHRRRPDLHPGQRHWDG